MVFHLPSYKKEGRTQLILILSNIAPLFAKLIHVAGAAALVWSYHPKWNYKQVKEQFMKTVDLLPSLEGKTVTGGRINVAKALQATE